MYKGMDCFVMLTSTQIAHWLKNLKRCHFSAFIISSFYKFIQFSTFLFFPIEFKSGAKLTLFAKCAHTLKEFMVYRSLHTYITQDKK